MPATPKDTAPKDSAPRNKGSRRVPCTRRELEHLAPDEDTVVVEEPIEFRVDGRAVATVMRTPGHDTDLALGFLYSEGWISSTADVGSAAFCARESALPVSETGGGNVVEVLSPSGSDAPRRPPVERLPVSSSCGVCGKRTIDEVFARTPLVSGHAAAANAAAESTLRVAASTLATLPDRLRKHQALFTATGALHAAGLFDAAGDLLVVREDIGRHNAVDKVVGWGLREGRLPLSSQVLQVSGRTSFEIVQKAYAAGIPLIAGVSGVSSLAIDLAQQAGITLVGFLRGSRFTVYTYPERVEAEPSPAGQTSP